ncbi:hypothetical protein Hanom_Chr11g00981111 [Helianthus anomalus]
MNECVGVIVFHYLCEKYMMMRVESVKLRLVRLERALVVVVVMEVELVKLRSISES